MLCAPLPPAGLRTFTAGPTTERVVSAYNTGVVTLHGVNTEDDAQLVPLITHLFQGPAFAALDEGEALLWAASRGKVLVLDLAAASKGKGNFEVKGQHGSDVLTTCLNAKHGYFVTADANGDIAVWNNRHEEQPRRVLHAPEPEPWHLVASAGERIIAARHNPEVFVYDLVGESYEVRTLGSQDVNARQIRALKCRTKDYFVGFNDGSLQRIEFVCASKHNAFNGVVRGENNRIVVHKDDDGVRHAITAIEDVPGYPSLVVTGGGNGLYLVDMANPKRPYIKQLLSNVSIRQLSSSDNYLYVAAEARLVLIPWSDLTSQQQPQASAP